MKETMNGLIPILIYHEGGTHEQSMLLPWRIYHHFVSFSLEPLWTQTLSSMAFDYYSYNYYYRDRWTGQWYRHPTYETSLRNLFYWVGQPKVLARDSNGFFQIYLSYCQLCTKNIGWGYEDQGDDYLR